MQNLMWNGLVDGKRERKLTSAGMAALSACPTIADMTRIEYKLDPIRNQFNRMTWQTNSTTTPAALEGPEHRFEDVG